MSETFVFVVCGAREHVDTLNVSLRYLRHFTTHPIVVVTDLKRNEGTVEHDRIIDTPTPPDFDHHQASIFLKTSLHQLLDRQRTYCYLDSDVVAISRKVDRIFDLKRGPVTFASDHCRFTRFSPHAVRCGCLDRAERLGALMDAQEPYLTTDPILLENFRRLEQLVKRFEANRNRTIWKRLPPFVQEAIREPYYDFDRFFKVKGDFHWNQATQQWLDGDGHVLLDDAKYAKYVSNIESGGEFTLDRSTHIWMNADGQPALVAECAHLADAIRDRFGISIDDAGWTHWNGGVFLFDDEADPFMDEWRRLTLEAFADPYFRTRDQGTLAATAWRFGWENAPRLPREFNFIADAHSSGIDHKPGKGFTADGFASTIEPAFLHIYYDFGKPGWPIWDAVANIRL